MRIPVASVTCGGRRIASWAAGVGGGKDYEGLERMEGTSSPLRPSEALASSKRAAALSVPRTSSFMGGWSGAITSAPAALASEM
jgi:hypothetical protein